MKLLLVCVLFFGSAAWAQKLKERLGVDIKSPYSWEVDEAESCKDGKTVVLKCVDTTNYKIDVKVKNELCEKAQKVPYVCDGKKTVIEKPNTPVKYYWDGGVCMKAQEERETRLCPPINNKSSSKTNK